MNNVTASIASLILCAFLFGLMSSCTESLPGQLPVKNVEVLPIGLDATVTLANGEVISVRKFPDGVAMGNSNEGLTETNLHSHGYAGVRAGLGPELNLTLSRKEFGNAVSEAFQLGLRFWDPTFTTADDGTPPTKETLEEYFSPGRNFTVGRGEGFAQLGILIPTDDRSGTNYRSRTDYLDTQEGTVTVLSVTPFTPTSDLVPVPVTYSIVTFSYDVSVGVYEPASGAAPGEFRASKAARVEGTVRMVLQANKL